jgi:hypothetical protein
MKTLKLAWHVLNKALTFQPWHTPYYDRGFCSCGYRP